MNKAALPENWRRPLEYIGLSLREAKVRTVGITSPCGASGVTMMSGALAATYAGFGMKTLLIDISRSNAATDPSQWPTARWTNEAIRADESGFDRLDNDFELGDRSIFSNRELLQARLKDDLGHYEAIVVDLPAVAQKSPQHISPLAMAAACDRVLLVCMTGKDNRDTVSTAANLLTTTGAKIEGTVMNDFTSSVVVPVVRTNFPLR